MKNKGSYISAILLIMITFNCCKSKSDSLSKDVLILDEQNFRNETAEGVVLVDFWATWCMPCRAMAPVIEEIARETKGKIKVGKVDVDDNGSLAQQFNVQGIPNFIILKDGREVENLVGIQAKETLIQAIERHIQLK
jgi:thioredoxin 1